MSRIYDIDPVTTDWPTPLPIQYAEPLSWWERVKAKWDAFCDACAAPFGLDDIE